MARASQQLTMQVEMYERRETAIWLAEVVSLSYNGIYVQGGGEETKSGALPRVRDTICFMHIGELE
jgi:hypothetical protein